MRVDQSTVAALAHQVYRILAYCGRVTFIHETFLETYREVAEANHLGGGLPYITYLPFVRRIVQERFANDSKPSLVTREAAKTPTERPMTLHAHPAETSSRARGKNRLTGKMAAANDRD